MNFTLLVVVLLTAIAFVGADIRVEEIPEAQEAEAHIG